MGLGLGQISRRNLRRCRIHEKTQVWRRRCPAAPIRDIAPADNQRRQRHPLANRPILFQGLRGAVFTAQPPKDDQARVMSRAARVLITGVCRYLAGGARSGYSSARSSSRDAASCNLGRWFSNPSRSWRCTGAWIDSVVSNRPWSSRRGTATAAIPSMNSSLSVE